MNEMGIGVPDNNKTLRTCLSIAVALHLTLVIILLFSLLPPNEWPITSNEEQENPLIINLQQEDPLPLSLPPLKSIPDEPQPTPPEPEPPTPAESLDIAAVMPHYGLGMAESIVKESSSIEIDGEELKEPEPLAENSDLQEQIDVPLASPTLPLKDTLCEEQQDQLASQPNEPPDSLSKEEASFASKEIMNTWLEPKREVIIPSDKPFVSTTPKRKPQKKPLTLADIAQSFLSGTMPPTEYLGEDNTNFWREGNPNIRPDKQELIKFNYLNKFIVHFRRTCECSLELREIINSFDGTIPVSFYALLDKNGMLLASEVTPSKNQALNRNIEKLLKQASPYPPLPKTFNQESMTIDIGFYIQGCASLIKLQHQTDRRRNQLDKYRKPFYN